MATKTYYLNETKKGDIICWDVCSQCGNFAEVKLFDDNTDYFVYTKNFTDHRFRLLGQNYSYFTGDKLSLTITIPNSAEIRQSISTSCITDDFGNVVGYVYSFCIEDSTDNDYNDIYVNVCAWRKNG